MTGSKKHFSRIATILSISLLIHLSCGKSIPEDKYPDTPLFQNSIVSNDIDFILREDSSTFKSINYMGKKTREMPDRRNDELMDHGTFVFELHFFDNTNLEVWAHSSFDSYQTANVYAQMVSGPLGKLPGIMRANLDHVVIHSGNETAFGESEGHFFVLYSGNMETRIANHDLEETVFHESVHATLESTYKNDPVWLKAQKDDSCFITQYAADHPEKEDLPETALFAYTMIRHSGRLSGDIEGWMGENIPNKLGFFRKLFK